MCSPLVRRLPLCLALASVFIAHSHRAFAQVGADTAAPEDAAQRAFQRGNEHAKAGRWAEALSAYQEAYAARPAWDIAGNLGVALIETGDAKGAATHLDEALRGFPGSGKPGQRKLLEEAFARARKSVGTLSIRTSQVGASLTVDGVSVGRAPLERRVFVTPGRHRIEAASAAGVGEQEVEIAAGDERDVLVAIQPLVSHPSGTPTTPTSSQGGRPLWPGLVLGGVGLAGLGTGIALAVASNGASGDAEALVGAAQAAGTPCSGNESSGPCGDAVNLLNERDALATGSVIALVVGGAATIGSVLYFVWPSQDGSNSAATVAPVLGPGVVGGRAVVSF